jgi:hypothetical protein
MHAGEVHPVAPALSAAEMVRSVREEARNPRESVNRVIHDQQGHSGGDNEGEQPEGRHPPNLQDSTDDDSPDAIVDVSTDYLASEEAHTQHHLNEDAVPTDPTLNRVPGSSAAVESQSAPERHVNIEV